MFAALHSDLNSHKSGLLHLTGQPYCKKCRSAKVKGGIINLFLRNYLVGRCINYDSKEIYKIGREIQKVDNGKKFFSINH